MEIYILVNGEWEYGYIDYYLDDEVSLSKIFNEMNEESTEHIMFGIFSEYGRPERIWHKGEWYDARKSDIRENS